MIVEHRVGYFLVFDRNAVVFMHRLVDAILSFSCNLIMMERLSYNCIIGDERVEYTCNCKP